MTDLNISVCAELQDKKLADALKNAVPPENIILTFSDKTEESFSKYAGRRLQIIITDSTERVDSLAKKSGNSLKVVFVGKAKLSDALDDVWASDDPDEIKCRFERFLAHLRSDFAAKFYENVLLTTIDTVPDMLWYKLLDGIHTMVNTAFTEVVHKTRDDIIGKDHFYIWDAPKPAEGNKFACAESEEIAIRTGKTYICDEPVKTREGMKQLTTYKTPIYDMFGNVFGTVGVGHDVTNFSNLGIELSILVENIPFPMIIFTSDMKVVRMNESFIKVAGIDAEKAPDFDYELWRKQILVPVNEEENDDVKHLSKREYKIIRKNEEFHFVVRRQEIRNFFDNVSGYFLIMTDVTYQRAYEQSILKAANTDMLTGMYNRRYFYNYLSEHTGKPMTMLYMDLDRFKYVNDHYGHAKGDEVLIKTAKVIKTRFPNAVSARLGGDEFALIFDGVLSDEEIKSCSLNLESTIQRIFTADGLPVTMSIGAAVYDGIDMNVDEFMHIGDQKMYDAKKRHHDRYK